MEIKVCWIWILNQIEILRKMNEVNHKQGPCWNMFEISIAFLNENQMDTYFISGMH